jgi:hypothetical protein
VWLVQRAEIDVKKEQAKKEEKAMPTIFRDINHQDKNGKTPLYVAGAMENVRDRSRCAQTHSRAHARAT